jgi:5-carboxymethyl-2-hydroxymuconate isomerase
MPHIVVEYTDNLAPLAEIPVLLRKIADKCGQGEPYLAMAGVRVRAVRLTEYAIADGKADYGFVNITAKIGSGRPAEFKKAFFGELFEIIQTHLAPAAKALPLALSMYVEEIDEDGAYRDNGIRRLLGLAQK